MRWPFRWGSFQPQIPPFMPFLDRRRRITLIPLVVGADWRLDPGCLVAQQQVYIRRRRRERRVYDLREGVHQLGPVLVPDPERRAAMAAETSLGRTFLSV